MEPPINIQRINLTVTTDRGECQTLEIYGFTPEQMYDLISWARAHGYDIESDYIKRASGVDQ